MTGNPHLGPETGQHNPTCNAITAGPVSAPAVLCGEPALVHALIDEDDNNVLACADHSARVGELFDVLDVHPAAHLCVMPGAVWSVPEKRCLIEGLDAEWPELAATTEHALARRDR